MTEFGSTVLGAVPDDTARAALYRCALVPAMIAVGALAEGGCQWYSATVDRYSSGVILDSGLLVGPLDAQRL